MRAAHIVGMIVWASLILALLTHGCSVLKKSRQKLSPAFLHRKMMANADFFSFDSTARLRARKRSEARASARSRARGDLIEDPAGNEIDPRYGVEKRLVPTGPNPLHH
ncbi:unnamed protein product [Victoria cruziana]